MRVTIRTYAGDNFEESIADYECIEESELKRDFPILHAQMELTWRRVNPDEKDAIDYGDLDMDWMGQCSDDCFVEPDGRCPHGFYSLGIRLGLI